MVDESKLAKEIEELENTIFGEVEVEEHSKETELEVEEIIESLSTDNTLDTEDSEINTELIVEEEKPKKRTNWRKRYTDLQSYADSTKYEMSQELREMQEQLHFANQEVETLKAKEKRPKSSLSELLTQQDKDMLGDETVDSLSSATKKVIDQSVNPLKEELKKERERRHLAEQKSMQDAKRVEYVEFEEELIKLSPEYAELNKDQKFTRWLSMKDTYSKASRFSLLRHAEKGRDALAVSRFFNEYLELTAPKVDDLREQVAPNSSSSTSIPGNTKDKVWTKAEMDSTYAAIRSGEVSHEKGLKLMSAIEDAVLSGRVQ